MATEYEQYEQYERDCEEIREENAELMKDFSAWLRENGVSDATARRHLGNIDPYVNHYLLEEEAIRAADGCSDAGAYLGFWFIRKVSATPSAIRSNAASLKKFYAFMVERDLVEPAELADLTKQIRNGMPRYLERGKRYTDPSITDPDDVWEF